MDAVFSARTKISAAVLLAGVLPWLLSVGVRFLFGTAQRVQEPLHACLEVAGACIALSVAMLLLLRARHEEAPPHLFWVIAALVAMGLMDGVHGAASYGVAWSWLRHGATLVGGLAFAMVWLPVPALAIRRRQSFILVVAAVTLVVAASLWEWSALLPAPWAPEGYSVSVKAANLLGGLGFLASAIFFFRRYRRRARGEDLVFACHTLLFGASSALFGFSEVWAADWWIWHVFRLQAYAIVLLAAYQYVGALYQRVTHHAQQLENSVQARTAELRESEARLRFSLEACQIGAWDLDLVDHTAFRSLEHDRIFGYPRLVPQWTLEDFLRHVLPDYRAQVEAMVRQSAATRTGWACECRICRADGAIRWIWFAGRPYTDRTGRDHVAGVIQDITDRKRAEERTRLLSDVTAELLMSDHPQKTVESLCGRIMAHLDCQVFVNYLADEQAGRLHLNACAGIPEEAVREIEWLDYGVAVCGSAAKEAARIVVEDVQSAEDPRTNLVRSFGVHAYACHPLMNQRRVIGTLSFGSRLKPAFTADELGLMRAVADHVAIAMQRVRLMESLDKQARAAEAASEAKSRFLANMSHELRTPMNAILGMIDVALSRTVEPTVQDCLQTAKGSADLLLTLLNDLLDSAKIESGKLELESAPFSVAGMLDHVARVLSARAGEKGLHFRCRMPAEAPHAVVGDRTRLQQVLLNLAGNAIKFTERGEVEVAVCAVPQNGQAHLQFSVRDTGMGIPRSTLEQIFRPFAQADASMARRFGGTGLGLSISKRLVELMGGRLWVESEVGRGSTFHFTVQFPVADRIPEDPEVPAACSAPARRQLRILLVEDNPANQKLAAYILQDRGHRLELAGDGQAAVDLARHNDYDAILMDVQMPGMNGLEATAEIRKRENAGRRVPIIAVTAHAMRSDRQQCLAAGMDGYLSKPLNAMEMINLVESLAEGNVPLQPRAGDDPVPAETAAAPEGASVFDPEEALTRCFQSEETVREMIQCFFDEARDLLPQMRTALERGDLEGFGRLGHRLKGTVVYLGARPAEEAVLRVERFCKSGGGSPSEAEEAVNALESQCIALKAALARHPLATDPTV